MRAAVFSGAGGPEVITIKDISEPIAVDDQLLVRVRASGLNRAEILQRKGFYPAPADAPTDIPGLEFAGVVEKVNQSVKEFRTGQKVFGITGGGCQAEFVAVEKDLAMPIPDNLDFTTAAAIPEVYITATDAIYNQLQIKPGESVLVQAAGSSVGIALLQILKKLGCHVLGTSRSDWKLKKLKEMGLDTGINTQNQDFVEAVREVTGGKGVSACVDFIGAPILNKNIEVLAEGGRLLILGMLGGTEGAIDLNKVMAKRVKISSVSMRSRPLKEKVAATKLFREKVLPWIASGEIVPVVDKTFRLEELAAAHRYMEENKNLGKIVILVA